MVEGGVDEDGLKQIHEVLEDALDECGVERFSPETGEDFRYANGVADNPKTDAPKTQEEEYKIVEILEPGYRICGQEGYRVIVPSKVRINGMWEGVTQK